MQNKKQFKAACVLKGLEVKDLANELGVTTTTIYNKMNHGRFTFEEARKLSVLIGIENMTEMFFPEYIEAYEAEKKHKAETEVGATEA